MEKRFAFIIHPIDPRRDVSRKYPALGKLPVWLIDYLSLYFPPVRISSITGIRSLHSGDSAQGWFIACPLTPKRMMTLPPATVYRKIIQTGRLAERLGANLLGLGAFTSVVGDGGLTIASRLNIPVTTGDSYTVAIAVQAILDAAQKMDVPLEKATVAVVGASGAIGSVCAELLAPKVHRLLLVGKSRLAKLHETAELTRRSGRAITDVTTDISRLREAHMVLTVTSAVESIIEPGHLRRGAVVCDVSRPRDVSRSVVAERADVLIIEGGMVRVPGPVDFGFDFGFPPQMAYACMAETMALTLDGQFVSYTLGKNIKLAQVQSIDRIAARHGFRLGGFRSFERAITEQEMATIKQYSRSQQAGMLYG